MLHFSKERFALMHFTKFDHHLTASPPRLPSISASSATPPTTITIKHTQPFLSDAPTQTHTHPNKVGQSAIPGRLLSTVKKQTTAPTLNVNVLRRRTRPRRRSREAAGRGKTRQTNQKKKKKKARKGLPYAGGHFGGKLGLRCMPMICDSHRLPLELKLPR